MSRSTGVDFAHFAVNTTRVLLEEVAESPGLLRVVGTITSRLCVLPVRKVHTHQSAKGGWEAFRKTMRSLRRLSMPVEPEGSKSDDGSYRGRQWCMAILPAGSTVDSGPCKLVSPRRGSSLHERAVEHSLREEMVSMGCIDGGEGVVVDPLPPHTNPHNRSMVTLPMVVENLVFCYLPQGGGGGGFVLGSVDALPSQCLDVHRYMMHGSSSMLVVRDGFRRLWARSFEVHSCYSLGVDGCVCGIGRVAVQ